MQSNEAGVRQERVFFPSIGGFLFVLMLGFFLIARPYALLGDGGTCRHMLTGEYILKHGQIPATNYLSAFDSQRHWLTHELLCDLIFAPYFLLGGLNWVILTSALALVLSFTWCYQIARYRGLGPISGMFALLLVIEASSIHWSARPHLFSYLTFLGTYYFVFVSTLPFKKRALYVSFIMFLWGNLHGSYFLGLILLICRVLGDWIGSPLDREAADGSAQQQKQTVRQGLTMLLLSTAASCLNLRGVEFFSYVLGYMSNPAIRMNSDEWRSIDFSFLPPAVAFLLVFAFLAKLWVYSPKKPHPGEFLSAGLLFCASLYAMRLVPYFVLAALPAAAPAWESLCAAARAQAGSCRAARWAALEERVDTQERATGQSSLIWTILAVALSLLFLFVPALRIQDFDPSRLPVAAVSELITRRVEGVGFCRDNWGDYLYWRTGKPIFIDDKTDFYPPERLQDYASLYLTYPVWEAVLKKYDFAYLLLPKGLPLTFLVENKGWKKVYEDSVAVLFLPQRQSAEPEAAVK